MRVPRGLTGKAGWSVLLVAVLALLATGSDAAMRKIDFDGDGRGDLAVYRGSEGAWYIKNSSGGTAKVAWGDPASFDIPVAGDYDNDAITDVAVWRPTNSTWYIKNSTGGATVVQWGDVSLFDVPVPGDYDGDGKTDIAVWRASNGTWYIRNSSGGATVVQWGDLSLNDRPMPGDYDGDGITDIAVWRGSNGTWYIRNSAGGTTVTQWGDGTLADQVTLGDFDGDGIVDPAVWRSSTGTWYVKKSTGGAIVTQWGDRSLFDLPYPVYADDDNAEDIAVWRRTSGTWYVKQSSNGEAQIVQWGDRSEYDQPIAAFLRPGVMDTIGIYNGIKHVVDLYATSIPDNTALDPVFHPNYLERGNDKAMEIAAWTTGGEGPPVGWTFTDLHTTFIGTNPNRYLVHFNVCDNSGTPQMRVNMVMARYGTSYVIFGDQTPIETEIGSAAIAWVHADNNVTAFNGLRLNVGDWQNNHPEILSVKIAGPGLVDNVILDRQSTSGWFPISGTSQDLLSLDDTTIATMGDIGGYTCQYYDGYGATGTQVASTRLFLLKRPVLSTELSPANFPALVSPTSHEIAAANPGGVLDVSWTNPPDTFSNWASLQFGQDSFNQGNLGMNQTSTSFDSSNLPYTPTNANLQINVQDKYYRMYELNWEFGEALPPIE